MNLDSKTKAKLVAAQRDEVTEAIVYRRLAAEVANAKTRGALEKIAAEEEDHYAYLKRFTGQDVAPSRAVAARYYWIARLLGLNFGVRLMERGEKVNQRGYESIAERYPELREVISRENHHEKKILDLMDEGGLKYTGSVILGLNDALVELTGALAGLTLALQNTRLIAIVGLITGIAASMAMAASEFLATKEEETNQPAAATAGKHAAHAGAFTGVAYITAVIILITPFFIVANPFAALAWSLGAALLIIGTFSGYVAVAKDEPFVKKFSLIAAISLGVAVINFGVGWVIRATLGVDI